MQVTKEERDALLAEQSRLTARRVEMNQTLEGCDWCCGGGAEEWDEIGERLNEIASLLKEEK